jgi:hypothetical protein
MATNFGRTRCRSRERTLRLRGEVEREHLVQPLGEKQHVICADEKTSINDKHLTVKRQVGLDNHGSPPMTPAYVQRSTLRGRQDSTITGIR